MFMMHYLRETIELGYLHAIDSSQYLRKRAAYRHFHVYKHSSNLASVYTISFLPPLDYGFIRSVLTQVFCYINCARSHQI